MCRSSVQCSSDSPGVNPATNDRMILYYCLTTKSGSVLGDSTVFSWAGCHNCPPVRAPTEVDAVLRSVPVGPLVTKQAGHRLFKALKFPLACAAGSFSQCAPPLSPMAAEPSFRPAPSRCRPTLSVPSLGHHRPQAGTRCSACRLAHWGCRPPRLPPSGTTEPRCRPFLRSNSGTPSP
jgi:hypothetical protein